MAPSSECAAQRRLQRITASVHPLSPVACVQQTIPIAEMLGQVYARSGGYKVCMYVGDRGVALAQRSLVQEAFARGSLEVHWAESLGELRPDTDIIVTTGTAVGEDELSKCSKLSLIAVAFTGTDHVDFDACRAHGVTVINAPDYSTDSSAQLVLGLVLEHLNHLPACHATIQNAAWACPPQEDMQSKKVGIVGTGSLGVRCAELFKAFKVKGLIGYDLERNPGFLACGGTYLPSLAALFLDADIVVICLPLTNETRGLISERILQLLRPDSLLVNIGRGDVVDEVAMANLLKDRRFRAALDVFSREPLPADNPLRSVPADVLLMTPHVGYQSTTSLEKRFDATVKNILAFLAGQAMNVVR